jgi:hypothetical protein
VRQLQGHLWACRRPENWFMLLGRAILVAGVLISILVARPSRADELAAAIEKLLEVGWSITPQARGAADAQYQSLAAVAAGDVRAAKAWWLVLLTQRRFDEALKQVEQYLEREPDDLAALRARAWLLTLLKNYSAAFVALDRVSAQIAAGTPGEGDERALQEESIAFLGRLMGYLGGPAADHVNQEQRKSFEKRMLDRLPESQRPLFEDARNGVLGKFIEMTDESAAARERSKAASAAEKAKTLAELEAEQGKIDERAKEIEERQKKLNNELRAELADVDRQEQPLIQQQTQLGSRIEILNADLLSYSSQILALEQLAAKEKDPILRQQYLNQAASLSLVAGRMEADLLTASRLFRTVQSQRAGLQARRVQARSSTASQIDRLNRELNELDRRERRNEGIERRVGRATTGISGKERSLSAQAGALSTYDVFPVELEKARLLDSLK